MLRRTVWLLLGLLGLPALAQDGGGDAEWRLYQERFIRPEGRVIDTGNRDITHSEGQGFALLLATCYRDRATFERVWQWTRAHLQTREDKLFSWKWESDAAGGGRVTDPNNAGDADLLIAWALARAARLWERPAYAQAAKDTAAAVRAKLLRPSPHGLVLLPGEFGFEREAGGLILNPSYWVFPALRELAELDPDPAWEQLTASGLALLEQARFGRWQLPPDWVRSGDKLAPAEEPFRPRFGYDAIRVPLYLIWAGLATPERLAPFLAFWDYFEGARFTPAWTDLRDDSVDSYDAPTGIQAVVRLARQQARDPAQALDLPALDAEQDYYSASLLLLGKAAYAESRP